MTKGTLVTDLTVVTDETRTAVIDETLMTVGTLLIDETVAMVVTNIGIVTDVKVYVQ